MASFDSAMKMMKEVEQMRRELDTPRTTINASFITTFCEEIKEHQRTVNNESTVRELVNAYVNEQKTRPTNPAWDKFWES